jgi:pilus assembly protein Flp/PilA
MSTEFRRVSCQTSPRLSVGTVRTALAHLLDDTSGQDLIEYALIAAVMGLGTLVGVHGAANTIVNIFLQVGTSFTSAV